MSWQASRSSGDGHAKYGSYVLGHGLSKKSLLADRYQEGAGCGGARGSGAIADEWRLPQMSSPRMRLLTPRAEESASYKQGEAGTAVRLPTTRRAPLAAKAERQAAPVKRHARGADQAKWPVWHLRGEPGEAETLTASSSRTAEPPSKPRDRPARPCAGGDTTANRSEDTVPSSPSKGNIFTEGDLRRRQRDRQSRRRGNAIATLQAYLRCAALHGAFVETMQQRHSAASAIQRQWGRHTGAKRVQQKKQEAKRVHNAAARIQASWRGLAARRALGRAPQPSSRRLVGPSDTATSQAVSVRDREEVSEPPMPCKQDPAECCGEVAHMIVVEDVATDSIPEQEVGDVARIAVEETLDNPDLEQTTTDLRTMAERALADSLLEVTTARLQARLALEEAELLRPVASEESEDNPCEVAQLALVSALAEVPDPRSVAKETLEVLSLGAHAVQTSAQDIRIVASRVIDSALAHILLEDGATNDLARTALTSELCSGDQEHDAIRLLVQSALDSAVLQTSEAESRHCRKRTKDVLQEALEDDGAHKAVEGLAQDAVHAALAIEEAHTLDHHQKSSTFGQHVSLSEDAHVDDARRPSLGEEIAKDAAAVLLRSALQKADVNSSRRSSSASDASVAIPETRGSGILQAALAGLLVEHDLEVLQVHMEDSSTEGDAWNFLDICSVPDSSAVSCELVDFGEN
mmetsp:Transcript_10893/g.24751  ORF Transcript_10893/g.24751 Transcript_10893/m.24751 type:complete len:692 (+) Transcript_10893:101-2176(+)